MTAPRDAATLLLVRDPVTAPRLLMGRRSYGAAFLPGKYVFPGGAVGPGDAVVPFAAGLNARCADRLEDGPAPPHALAAAAIRELWEETGLILGTPGAWPQAPAPEWRRFAAGGYRPTAAGMSFVFRAVTPPGPPRRFDARFFLADAAHVANLDEVPLRGDAELADLRWMTPDEIRGRDLAFVTELVLAGIVARLPALGPPEEVPVLSGEDEARAALRLGGARAF